VGRHRRSSTVDGLAQAGGPGTQACARLLIARAASGRYSLRAQSGCRPKGAVETARPESPGGTAQDRARDFPLPLVVAPGILPPKKRSLRVPGPAVMSPRTFNCVWAGFHQSLRQIALNIFFAVTAQPSLLLLAVNGPAPASSSRPRAPAGDGPLLPHAGLSLGQSGHASPRKIIWWCFESPLLEEPPGPRCCHTHRRPGVPCAAEIKLQRLEPPPISDDQERCRLGGNGITRFSDPLSLLPVRRRRPL